MNLGGAPPAGRTGRPSHMPYSRVLSSRYPVSPWAIVQSLRAHRHLITQMTRRELMGRYRGSVLGMLWSFLHPLLMLMVYTFVFATVFKARWGGAAGQENTSFAAAIFAGLLVHGLFAECLGKAPSLVAANPVFVKKVVFPLEIMPWTALGAALAHFFIGMSILVGYLALIGQWPPLFALVAPLLLVPMLMMVLGLSWIFAATGVFLRDLAQIVGLLMTVALFMSPTFYPIDAVPEAFRAWIYVNPLTMPIETFRAALLWGTPPDWSDLGLYTAVAFLVMCLGFWWFQRVRHAFADVM
jgi:lipopolysaccharide transport system permease protein